MLNKDYYILLSILETTEKIFRYTGSYHSAEELYQNDRDFDAAMMNFIVVGELVGKLTEEVKSKMNRLTGERYILYAMFWLIIILELMLILSGK